MAKKFADALAAAESKGALPHAQMFDEPGMYFNAFVLKRKSLVSDKVGEIMKTMKATLNEGQVRAAANAFDPRGLSLTKKPEELTEDETLDAWVRVVLLDNHTHHILSEMSKRK